MAKAKGAAERALGIDPTSAEGHTWLGAVEMHYGWDWDAAGRRFRQAISLSPNLAEAYSWYAWYLTWVEDRYDEALEAYEEAERLDPLALEIKHLRAYTHYAAGKLDLALESFRGLLEIEEGYAQAYYGIGDVYNQQGRLDDAILEFEKSLELGGRATNAVALLAYLYGLAGRPEEAWPLINELEERASRGYVSELWTAIAYAGMGEADKMFDYLERGYRGRDPAMVYLSRTHEFDAYRSDPRFRTLLEKMGLERFDL
jgi:tetratricopeptide (TPR) repeat protein